MIILEVNGTRTFKATGSKGEIKVTTNLTDAQAIETVSLLRGDFARSLTDTVQKQGIKSLSPLRLAWFHKLAFEFVNPVSTADRTYTKAADLLSLQTLFSTAKANGMKKPRVYLKAAGVTITVSAAPDKGKNAGFLYVTHEEVYYGKISPAGEFFATHSTPPSILDGLKKLSANPVLCAAEYAQITGACCFCGHLLTDPVSVELNYGPVCAAHWGLPHRAK